jgi:hypothetical protein
LEQLGGTHVKENAADQQPEHRSARYEPTSADSRGIAGSTLSDQPFRLNVLGML